MLLSNPNRKSFSLSLNLPLSRISSSSRSKDHHKPSYSPLRDGLPSPHSPLVPASLHFKPEQPILPVSTADGLDPNEKMKLLRKSRKLSRILGEVPIPVSTEEANDLYPATPSEEPSTSASSSAFSSPAELPPGIGRADPLHLHRSATVGHNIPVQKGRVQRTRSLTSLTIAAEARGTRPSPVSPAACAYSQTLPPLPASPISPDSASGDSGKQTIGPSRRGSFASVSSRHRHDSTSSSILFIERTPEQLQRARAAKLARQLGENIPPDLLLRASSPIPRSFLASPPIEASRDNQEPQVRRTSSMKRANQDRSKRRLSLDVRAFVRGPDPRDAPSPVETLKHRVLHKKSYSSINQHHPSNAGARIRPPPMTHDSDVDSGPEDDAVRPGTVEKQRALNVRRARKMNQMFGNDPPPALYQITNFRPGAADESVSVSLSISDRRRDSGATFVSAATSFSAPELDDSGSQRKSEESSSGENLSPLVFAEAQSTPPSGEHPPNTGASADGDDEPVLLPYLNSKNGSHTDTRAASPYGHLLSSPSEQSIAQESTVSIPQSTALSYHSGTPLTYPAGRASPPPFLNMFHWGSGTSTPVPTARSPTPSSDASSLLSAPQSPSEMSPSDPLFRMRRNRAAKLSRFFGVGLHDITGMLVADEQPTPTPTPSSTVASTTKPLPPIPDAIPPVPPVPSSLYSACRPDSSETSPTSPPSSPMSVRVPSEEPRPRRRSSARSSGRRSRSQSARRAPGQPQSQPQPPTPTKSSCSTTPSGDGDGDGHEQGPPTPTKSTCSGATGERGSGTEMQRSRSNSEPDVSQSQSQSQSVSMSVSQQASQRASYNRSLSTTVEVAAEPRGKYFYRRSRQPRELEMHAAIKQLRKIK